MKATMFTIGCVAGFAALTMLYANCLFKTCENLSEYGFTCSRCKSHTGYKPKVPFRFCPICGAYVIEKSWLPSSEESRIKKNETLRYVQEH
jgi:rRNA maturation endonuclease Nob1